MRTIVIACFVVAIVGATAYVLTRTGNVRRIAPVAVVVVGMGVLAVVGLPARDRHAPAPVGAGPAPSPDLQTPVAAPPVPQTPAPPDGPFEVTCPRDDHPIGPADESTFPVTPASASTRHAPFQISGLPGAGGPVILGSAEQYQDIRRAVRTAGTALTNYESFTYRSARDSRSRFLNLEIAEPAVGVCALRLVYTVLQGPDGNQVSGIKLLSPGPALARHHAVLACGGFGTGNVFDSCAWASTDDASRRVFGAMWAFGGSMHEHPLSEQQIVELVDLAFTAVDA